MMSLFDVIRYPINYQFHFEDLDRIPRPIIHKWIDDDFEDKLFSHFNRERATHSIFFYLQLQISIIKRDRLLKCLQKRIKEYDELV